MENLFIIWRNRTLKSNHDIKGIYFSRIVLHLNKKYERLCHLENDLLKKVKQRKTHYLDLL